MFNKVLVALFLGRLKSAILEDIDKDQAYYLTLAPADIKTEMCRRIQSKRSLPGELRRIMCGVVNSAGGANSMAILESVRAAVQGFKP
jgi:hypothetical protein